MLLNTSVSPHCTKINNSHLSSDALTDTNGIWVLLEHFSGHLATVLQQNSLLFHLHHLNPQNSVWTNSTKLHINKDNQKFCGISLVSKLMLIHIKDFFNLSTTVESNIPLFPPIHPMHPPPPIYNFFFFPMWCTSSSIKTNSMADTHSLHFMEILGFFFYKSCTVLGQNDSFLYLKTESIQFFFFLHELQATVYSDCKFCWENLGHRSALELYLYHLEKTSQSSYMILC